MKLINSLGAQVVDQDSRVLMVAETGMTTKYLNALKAGSPTARSNDEWTLEALGDLRQFISQRLGANTYPAIHSPQIPPISFTYFNVMPSHYSWAQYLSMPVLTGAFASKESLCFYQTYGHANITLSMETVWELDNIATGSLPHVWTVGNVSVPYMLVTPFSPDVMVEEQAGENYGMRILNGDGDVVYDSRYQAPPIAMTILLDQDTIEDIMDNNTHVDVTLPESMPNCWIAAPALHTYRDDWYRTGGHWYWRRRTLSIGQINNTTIRISRNSVVVKTTNNNPRNNTDYIQNDVMIFVSRDIS
ncbi:hypothetical protein [Celeribacter sp.]|uniref:hypothetical protein n=1 Tax=Celeribacter sp. TaxID=1890673 RepID=UPI003A931A33